MYSTCTFNEPENEGSVTAFLDRHPEVSPEDFGLQRCTIEDIKTGIGKTTGKYVTIIDRAEAVKYALEHSERGDVIVLAGKGHEDYQEIRGVKHHMDEVELVMQARKELGC